MHYKIVFPKYILWDKLMMREWAYTALSQGLFNPYTMVEHPCIASIKINHFSAFFNHLLHHLLFLDNAEKEIKTTSHGCC